MPKFNYPFIKSNIILAGGEKTGKSSLFKALQGNAVKKTDDYQPNLGTNICYKSICNDELFTFSIKLTDTAGKAAYLPLLPMYLAEAEIIAITLDLKRTDSIDNAKSIVKQAKTHNPQATILLIATSNEDESLELSASEQEKITTLIDYSQSLFGAKKLHFIKANPFVKTHISNLEKTLTRILNERHSKELLQQISITQRFQQWLPANHPTSQKLSLHSLIIAIDKLEIITAQLSEIGSDLAIAKAKIITPFVNDIKAACIQFFKENNEENFKHRLKTAIEQLDNHQMKILAKPRHPYYQHFKRAFLILMVALSGFITLPLAGLYYTFTRKNPLSFFNKTNSTKQLQAAQREVENLILQQDNKPETESNDENPSNINSNT